MDQLLIADEALLWQLVENETVTMGYICQLTGMDRLDALSRHQAFQEKYGSAMVKRAMDSFGIPREHAQAMVDKALANPLKNL